MSKPKESSTFRRLLRSEHVRDLRWIFFGALAFAFLVAISAFVFKVHPILADAPTVAPQEVKQEAPAQAVNSNPSTQEAKLQSLPQEAKSKSPPQATNSEPYTWSDTVKFILAIAAAGATVMAWAYQTGSRRLGVVDLFACEIITLCRVGTVVGFVESLREQYESAGQPREAATAENPRDELHFSSQENYFPVFESNARDLQILEADVVKHVTEFYTYMKATRDMLRLVSELETKPIPPEKRREAIANVIYMIFLGYESARLAIDDLIEYEPTQAESKMVVLFTELRAYKALQDAAITYVGKTEVDKSRNELRKARLDLRRANYTQVVPELIGKVRLHAGEEYWKKASSMVDGLERLYEQYFRAQPTTSTPPSEPPVAANAA